MSRSDIAIAFHEIAWFVPNTSMKRVVEFMKHSRHRRLRFDKGCDLDLVAYLDCDYSPMEEDRHLVTG